MQVLGVRGQGTAMGVRNQRLDNRSLHTVYCRLSTVFPQPLAACAAMYSDQVLDHFHHPRNVGEIEDATVVVETSNPACGDLMKLWAVVRDGVIVDVRFKVAGCVPAVACASWLTERIKGMPLAELSGLAADQIVASCLQTRCGPCFRCPPTTPGANGSSAPAKAMILPI
jgi:hypothetical protein